MADGVSITESGTTVVSADEIGGEKFQRVKVTLGNNNQDDGTISSSNPMPVVQTGSFALPTGAATSALQTSSEAILTTIDADTGSMAASLTSIAAEDFATETTLAAVKTAVELIDNAISGSEMQVDIVAALPAGTNFIGKTQPSNGTLDNTLKALSTSLAGTDIGMVVQSVIHGLSSGGGGSYEEVKVTPSGAIVTEATVTSSALPTGASTLAEQQSQTTLLGTIDADTSALAACASGSELQVDIVSSALPSGASTLAEQQSQTTLLGTIDTDTGSMASSLTSIAAEDFATETTLALIETAVDGIEALLTTIDADTGTIATEVAGLLTDAELRATPVPVSGTVTAAPTYLDVIDFLDTNPVLDTSGTNIPASASNPLELVATLAADVKFIKVNDTTGEFIGVYTGAALSEVLQCIIGPGQDDQTPVLMTSGQRVSVRNMANSAISVGSLCIQFIG